MKGSDDKDSIGLQCSSRIVVVYLWFDFPFSTANFRTILLRPLYTAMNHRYTIGNSCFVSCNFGDKSPKEPTVVFHAIFATYDACFLIFFFFYQMETPVNPEGRNSIFCCSNNTRIRVFETAGQNFTFDTIKVKKYVDTSIKLNID